MNIQQVLSDFIVSLDFEDLSKESIISAKKILIDTIAVALAGSSAAGVRPVFKVVKEWGGKPESTVLVHGLKVPVYQSAFVNSMMAHALDYDDIHTKVAVHASCSVVPTVFSMSEYLTKLKGTDFVTAIVLGIEIASRLGLCILEQEKGWHLSAVCGSIANAAVAAKLLKLDADKIIHAMGIAYSQAAGTLQALVDGTLTKRMQPGFAAKSGIVSAFLAKNGLTGPYHFLNGRYGFFNLYFSNNCDPEALTKNIGRDFEINHIGAKPYPCCRLAHSAIDAILDLKAAEDFAIDEVRRVTVHGSPAMLTMCGKPYKVTENSEIDAQFSLQYLIPRVILNRRIRIDDFSKDAVRNPVISANAKKITVKVSPEIKNRWGTIVEVEKLNGQHLTRRIDEPKGQPENPMSWDEYLDKFHLCSQHAEKPLDQEKLNQFIQRIEKLETLSDTSKIVTFLTP